MRFFLALMGALSVAFTAAAASPDSTFNLATYNIRLQTSDDDARGDGWLRRRGPLTELVGFHRFDIFGTQEGFKNQLEDIKSALPGYQYIGVGRDDGAEKGEHAAIFYREDLFDLLDHGDFWLSETPDRPGLGWDAACVRICTWGKFRHRPSGKEFLYFNLHLDHVGVVARAESAKLIARKIDEIDSTVPVFLSGDFNVDQHSADYQTILNSGTLVDSFGKAKTVYAPTGTFNAFDPDSWSDNRIDHIFLSPEVEVGRYGILTDTYRSREMDSHEMEAASVPDKIETDTAPAEIGIYRYVARTPSDHFPVLITVTLP